MVILLTFHPQNGGINGNGVAVVKTEKETSFSVADKEEHTGVVSIDFETREGSGKIDKDFKYAQGTLVSACVGGPHAGIITAGSSVFKSSLSSVALCHVKSGQGRQS